MCELLTNAYLAVCSVVLIWYGLFCIIEAVHIEIIDLLVKVKSHYSMPYLCPVRLRDNFQ